jgi:shikimate dehydrogenase
MRKFGLIGYPLGHSFSMKYFSGKFQRELISDCQYSNFEIPSINHLPDLLKDPELEGLNITIPYKQDVIPFLHETTRVVKETGACNCIKIKNQKLTGYNTDVEGFEKSLEEKLTVNDKRALILGTGGSSRAVAWVLQKRGIGFLLVSRNKSGSDRQIVYEDLNRALMQSHSLIINCTPLGMTPKTEAFPPLPYEWIGTEHYLFDLIYNPVKTVFLEMGERAGARIKNGQDMLAIQADASWAIWNSDSAD